MQNLTINNQIFPFTNIQNTRTVNHIIRKSDLEAESKTSEQPSPEDDDEEFIPKEIPKLKEEEKQPKRKGRPPKSA